MSPRELEILRLIARGGSNREIATTLAISEGTVRVHASNIFAKLGCNDRAQAVSEAFQRELFTSTSSLRPRHYLEIHPHAAFFLSCFLIEKDGGGQILDCQAQ